MAEEIDTGPAVDWPFRASIARQAAAGRALSLLWSTSPSKLGSAIFSGQVTPPEEIVHNQYMHTCLLGAAAGNFQSCSLKATHQDLERHGSRK
jgi:hypothetical protein